jgi:hypothetical protein
MIRGSRHPNANPADVEDSSSVVSQTLVRRFEIVSLAAIHLRLVAGVMRPAFQLDEERLLAALARLPKLPALPIRRPEKAPRLFT